MIKDAKTGKNRYIDDDGLNAIDSNGVLTGRLTEKEALKIEN